MHNFHRWGPFFSPINFGRDNPPPPSQRSGNGPACSIVNREQCYNHVGTKKCDRRVQNLWKPILVRIFPVFPLRSLVTFWFCLSDQAQAENFGGFLLFAPMARSKYWCLMHFFAKKAGFKCFQFSWEDFRYADILRGFFRFNHSILVNWCKFLCSGSECCTKIICKLIMTG